MDLPVYPKRTECTSLPKQLETRRRVYRELADAIDAELDKVELAFAVAFEELDAKQTTRDRLAALTARTRDRRI